MSHDLAICLYGPANTDATLTKTLCAAKFHDYDIQYFENYDHADLYTNLWLSNFKKRQHEIVNRTEFTRCLALDASVEWPQNSLPIPYISGLSEKLHYVKGGIDLPRGATRISLSAFFAPSQLFDIACGFGLMRGKFPDGIKSISAEEEFYHYLKSLRIKPVCVNYEDSSLFERTT
jgi:hypothetical protein